MFGAALAVLAAGYVLDVNDMRLTGLFGAVLFGVGTAPLQPSGRSCPSVRLGVGGVVGLSVLLLVGTLMVLLPLWHPLLAAVIIGTVAVAAHVQGLRGAVPVLRDSGVLRRLRAGRAAVLNRSTACTAVGTALWCSAMFRAGHIVPGAGGFLPHISVLWYVGLALLLGGILLALGNSETRAMLALVSLVAALTLTPAFVYGMPRSQSAGKHIDLVLHIMHGHHLDPGAGIYQAYSGFFSANAWVADLAQVHDLTALATYWPFIAGLVAVAELWFFMERLLSPGYRVLVAMTLAVLVNAIGADYFSPQSAGFVLGLGVYGLALGSHCPGLGDRMRVGLLLLAGCAVAVTHELSPFAIGVVLVALVAFRAARPWYLPATCLLPAALWAAGNRPVLTRYVSFADLGNLANFTPPKTVAAPGLHRMAIVGVSSYALMAGLLVLIALACAGLVRNPRDVQAWGFLASAGVGIAITAVEPYGNEGIFRAALFGIPWLAALAMRALPDIPPRWLLAGFGPMTLGLLAAFLIAMFGLDNQNVIRSSDMQALRVYAARASDSSYLLNLAYGNIPNSAIFPQKNHFLDTGVLMRRSYVIAGHPDAADVSALARRYIRYAASNGSTQSRELYAIWSPAAAQFALDYGLETRAQVQTWPKLIAASPEWKVVFSRDGTYLFRLRLTRERASVSNAGLGVMTAEVK